MKLSKRIFLTLASFIKPQKRRADRIFSGDYKQAMLIKLGREQFVSLMKKGINIPVVLL